ncbi:MULTISPECIES: M23 family metallopeptidase [Cyanophyceae]|uniref:M23 family metallopeptidase n=1 Tax=Cyanophyceae TaxID=3028117 RepID=UPI0024116912|nr:M23 family metallopeptidase [Phormidium sp. FACHB-592]
MTLNAHPTLLNRRYRVLVRGLGWIGSFGLLSSGMALAQGSADDVLTAPSMPSVDLNSAPIDSTNQRDIAPPEVSTPVFVAPTVPAPEPLSVQPQSTQPTAPSARPDYNDSYDAPTSIVLSERSTGCRAVLQSGQLLNGSPCSLDDRWQAANAKVTADRAASSISSSGNTSSGGMSVAGLGTTTAFASQTPTWQTYYKRTARPSGRLGNGNIRLIFPLSIPAPISSLFGWRVHPVSGTQRFHSGTDLAAPLGTPVLAAYAGKVAIADFLGGYGLSVALDHNKGTQQTLYAHLSEIFVKPGEVVKQGMVIGRVGSTGVSTGPHLHFEFRQLTSDGWVAMDAGAQLEYALAQLVKTMQVAQAKAAATRS